MNSEKRNFTGRNATSHTVKVAQKVAPKTLIVSTQFELFNIMQLMQLQIIYIYARAVLFNYIRVYTRVNICEPLFFEVAKLRSCRGKICG